MMQNGFKVNKFCKLTKQLKGFSIWPKRLLTFNNFQIMKSLLRITLSLIVLSNFLYSCNKKTSDINKQEKYELNYKIREVLNPDLLKRFKNFSNFKTLKSTSKISFDFSPVYQISKSNDTIQSIIMVNQLGYNKNNTKNYGFCVILRNSDDTFHSPFIAETDKVNKDIYKVSYFNGKHELIFSVIINSSKRTAHVIHQKSVMTTKDCGDKVVACLEDVYQNHGWASIAAFVTTAFIPATAAVFAADCYGHMCL